MASAIDTFKSTMYRANELMKLHNTLIEKFKDDTDIKYDQDELCRSALVLGVSALDHYFTDKFAECLIPYLKKHEPTKKLVDLLEKAHFDTLAALELISKDTKRPYRKLRTLIDRYFETYVTQKFDVIDDLFLSLGLKDLTVNAEKKAKRKNLRKIVENAIERRHEIVHGGDLNKYDKLQSVNYKEFKTRLASIELIILKCEEIINSRIG